MRETGASVPKYSATITISGRLFCQKTSCLPGKDHKEMTNSHKSASHPLHRALATDVFGSRIVPSVLVAMGVYINMAARSSGTQQSPPQEPFDSTRCTS